MSDFPPENVTSPFVETDSSIGEVASVVHQPLHTNLFAKIVEETVTRMECLEARGESNDEGKVNDVAGRDEVGVRSRAESDVFIFVDALRRANLIAASDSETVLGCPPVSTICTINFSCF